MNEKIKIILMIFLVIIIMSIPAIIFKIDKNEIIGKLNIENLPKNDLYSKKESVPYIEQIKMIKSNSESKDIVTRIKIEDFQKKTKLLKIAQNEISRLIELGLIAGYNDMNLKEKKFQITKIIYLTENKNYKNVVTYKIDIYYNDFSITTRIIDNYFKIYQLDLKTDYKNKKFSNFSFNVEKFLDYLEIPNEKVISELNESSEDEIEYFNNKIVYLKEEKFDFKVYYYYDRYLLTFGI